jgi:hypothetical protein
MNLDADIIAHPEPAQPAAADPRIARAEMWLCMLGALREVARRFSRFLLWEIMPHQAWTKGPALAFAFFFDPVPAFKRVVCVASFAAQLCRKIEKEIAAFRAGEPCDLDGFLTRAPRPSARSKSDAQAAAHHETDGENLDEFEDDNEFEDYNEREAPERYFERFSKRKSLEDKYAALLKGPLKDAIKAICADLGLKPNWRLWTDNGFPPPAGGGVEDWVAFFVPDADRRSAVAEVRRAAQPPPLGERDRAAQSAWPPPYPGATRPPDRGRLPDHPSGRTDTLGLTRAAPAPGR